MVGLTIEAGMNSARPLAILALEFCHPDSAAFIRIEFEIAFEIGFTVYGLWFFRM
jgi:hypothetical protein